MRKIVPFNNVLTFNTDVYEITAISLEHSLEKEVDNLSGVFYISGEYKILNGGITPEQFNFELPFDIALGTRYDMSSMVVDIDDFRYELVDNNKMKVNIDLYIDGEEAELEDNQLLEEVPLIKELNLQDEKSKSRENTNEDNACLDTLEETEHEEELTCHEQTNDEGDEKMDSQSTEVNNVEDTMEDDIKRESDLVKEFIYNDEEEQETSIINSNNNINIDNHNDNNVIANLSDEENYVTYKVYRIVEGDTLDSIISKYKVTKEELLNYNENISNLMAGDKLIIPFK